MFLPVGTRFAAVAAACGAVAFVRSCCRPSRPGAGVHLTRTTVDEVMNYIEEHSDYTFLYNDKTVDRTRRVSVDNAAGDIRAILDAVFAGTDVRYDIRDNQIILSGEAAAEAGRGTT